MAGWGYERVLSIDQTKGRDIVGWRRGRSRLFLTQCRKEFLPKRFHRKQVGINHIALWAPSQSVVERFYKEYLIPNKIPTLYGGPKEYEYRKGYYAVYFEDPDRLKLELVTAPSFSLNYKGVKRVNLPKH